MEYNFNDEKLKKAINDFINKIKIMHPIKTLKKLYIYRFLVSYGKSEGLKHKEVTILTNIITYLISIYQSIELETYNTNEPTFDFIEDIIDAFTYIYINTSISHDFSLESRVTSLKDVATGISYPMVTVELVMSLLSTQEQLIMDKYGINTELLYKELTALSMRLRAIPKIIELDGESLFDKIDKELEDGYFDLTTNTNIPTSLLKDLSAKKDQKSDFITRKDYSGWPNIDSPAKFYPLLENNGRIYAFDHNIIFDFLYRNIQRAITGNNQDLKNQWNNNQQISSEDLVAEIFSKILPDATYYKNNFYYESKNKRLENDLLIIDNDLLLVVEIKAGSFSYKSAVTDSDSHEESIKSLIDNPQRQVKNFLDNLRLKNKLEIYDEFKNIIDIINIKNFNYIIGVTVTIDHFNEITATYYNTDNDKIVALPISIYDLFIVEKYFENKFGFIHYLLFRLGQFASGMHVVDELAYLEMYITNHHSNQMLIEEKKKLNAATIMVEPTVEMMDKYFNDYPKLNNKNKPIKKIHSEFKRILRILSNKTGDIFAVTTTLLEIPYESQVSLIKESKKLAEWGNKSKKFGFVITEDNKTSLFFGYIEINRMEKFNLEHTFKEFNLKHLDKNNIIVCLIYNRRSKKIIDVIFKVEIKK